MFGYLDQVATYFVGLLPSHFHISLGKKDEAEFENLIIMSIGIVLFKAVVIFFLSIFDLKILFY